MDDFEAREVVQPQQAEVRTRWGLLIGLIVTAVVVTVFVSLLIAKRNCEADGKYWYWLPLGGPHWGCENLDD